MIFILVLLATQGTPLEDAAPNKEGDRFGRALLSLHDMDKDGIPEIAVGAPTASSPDQYSGHVLILSGANREILQTWRGEPRRSGFGETLRAAGDSNGDGTQDVLVGYETGDRTEVLSGVDGSILLSFDRTDEEVSPFGDLDQDGADDFLLAGEQLEVRSGRDGSFLGGHCWTDKGSAFQSVGDMDMDGLTDGVLLSDEPMLLLTAAPREGQRWSSFSNKTRKGLKELYAAIFKGREAQLIRCAPSGDLDGDGSQEFTAQVRVAETLELWALSINPPKAWKLGSGKGDKKSTPHTGYGFGYKCFAVGDLDHDGLCDVIIAHAINPFHVTLQAVTGKAGTQLWKSKLFDGGGTSGAAFALIHDPNDDGTPEILLGTADWFWHGTVYRSGLLRSLSGETGEPLWELGVDKIRER